MKIIGKDVIKAVNDLLLHYNQFLETKLFRKEALDKALDEYIK